MRGAIPLALFCLLALTACGGPSSNALRRRALPFKSGTIEMPANWKHRFGGSVGDHGTDFWYDPNDAFAKLRSVESGCEGCVANADGTPNPRGEIPQYATVTASPDPFTAAYHLSDTPYNDSGMVVVEHVGSKIVGSLIFDLWLPDKASAEAAQILGSYQPH